MALFMVSYDVILNRNYTRLETRLREWKATRVLLWRRVILGIPL